MRNVVGINIWLATQVSKLTLFKRADERKGTYEY